jgi:hypothetical protein
VTVCERGNCFTFSARRPLRPVAALVGLETFSRQKSALRAGRLSTGHSFSLALGAETKNMPVGTRRFLTGGKTARKLRYCESASNFDPTSICSQVFGTVSEFAIFTEPDRRPSVTPPASLKPIVDQSLGLMSSGVTVRRRFTLKGFWRCTGFGSRANASAKAYANASTQ